MNALYYLRCVQEMTIHQAPIILDQEQEVPTTIHEKNRKIAVRGWCDRLAYTILIVF